MTESNEIRRITPEMATLLEKIEQALWYARQVDLNDPATHHNFDSLLIILNSFDANH